MKSIKVLIVVLAIVLAGCGTDSEKESAAKEIKREKISATLTNLNFDKENETFSGKLKTNLPEGTVVDLYLHNTHIPSTVAYDFDAKVGKDGVIKSELSVDNISREYVLNGDYSVEMEIEVDGDDQDDQTENKDFMHDSLVGGYGDELQEEYEGSETVSVKLGSDSADNEDLDIFHYSIRVKPAGKIAIANAFTEQELSAEAAAEETAGTSDGSYDTSAEETAGTSDVSNGSYVDEAAYAMKMADHASRLQEKFVKFADLFDRADFNDMNWKIDLSVTITEIAALSQEPEEYDVPAKYEAAHAIYLDAMEDYKTAMDMLPGALDSMDGEQINEAKGYMDSALEKVKTVHSQIAQ